MKKQYINPSVAVANLLSQSVMQAASPAAPGLNVGGNLTGGGVTSDAPSRSMNYIE